MKGLFDKALARLLEFEGGWVNDPDDRGKETYRGITRKFHGDWQGWPRVEAHKPLKTGQIITGDATLDFLVAELYRNKYWAPVEAFGFPPRTTWKLFDTQANMGEGAVKVLQRVVGAAVDGVCGPKTIAATLEYIRLRGEGALLAAYCREQLRHYQNIVKCKPSQGKFLKGWTRRAAWLPPEVC